MNLAILAEEALERLGEHKSLDFEGETFTNAEQLELGRKLQRSFQDIGMGIGDISILCMINHPSVTGVFQGIFRSGAVAVPVMYMLQAPELRFVLEDTKASYVITDTFNLPKVREAIKGLDHIKWIAVREGKDDPEATPPEYSLDRMMEADAQTVLPNFDADSTALMLYTSGTTGKPKGVMLSHAGLIAGSEAGQDAGEAHRLKGPRVTLSAMPMAHIFGVGVMVGGYKTPEHLAGSYLVQMQWFEPRMFMENIQKHKVQTFASVPTMLTLIMDHPDNPKYDLSSVEEVVCGAAPLPVEVAKEFMRRYDCRVREIYGMTENGGIATANRPSDEYRPGSAGRPYKGVDLRIFDENENEVPAGERGEIVTKGPTTMKGYHNRPEATEEVMKGGWLHTGDIGYLDEDGFLYIVDRKKDMIIKGGENIYPAELEDVLYTHPDISEAAIVGVPHATYGEDVTAFVVPKPDKELTEEEVKAFMKKEVTKFKIPSRVFFKQALPKVGVGKILRRELREEAKKLIEEDNGAA